MGQRGIKERVELLINLGYEGFLDRINYIKFIEIDNGAELDSISIRTARTEHSLKNLAVRIDVDGKSVCYSGDGKLTSDVIKLFRRSNLAICECYSIKPIVQTHSCLEDLRFEDGPKLIALVHINRREREKVSCSTSEVGSFQHLEQALRLSPHLLVRGAHSSPIPCLSLRHGLKASRLPHLPHGLGTSEPWISGGLNFAHPSQS
jgi:hypothetical protein